MAYIGVAAPVIVLLSWLLQVFSAGAELGGISVYLAEISSSSNRGFYVSWQSASQQVDVISASGLGVLLHAYFNGLLLILLGGFRSLSAVCLSLCCFISVFP